MPTFINGRALATLFGFALAIAPEAASAVDRSVIAQTSPSPQSSPEASPEASAAPSATGPNLSKLTPAQQAALQAAIIKTSQNPVGNIAIIPFQNNFNYGVGPYTRFQYNLNMQPVVPLMLSKNMTLIARTIIPSSINHRSRRRPSARRNTVADRHSASATFRSNCSLLQKQNRVR